MSRTEVSKQPPMVEAGLPPVFINKEQRQACLFALSVDVFVLKWQNWVVATEILRPAKAEVFTIWPRRKCVYLWSRGRVLQAEEQTANVKVSRWECAGCV